MTTSNFYDLKWKILALIWFNPNKTADEFKKMDAMENISLDLIHFWFITLIKEEFIKLNKKEQAIISNKSKSRVALIKADYEMLE